MVREPSPLNGYLGADLPTTAFEPWPTAQLHVEWGRSAAKLAAERGDAVVVVDTLTFSTTVSTAVAAGAQVIALSRAHIAQLGGADVAAQTYGVPKPALLRDEAGAKLTLSPSSVTNLTPGDRVALVSLNGADVAGSARHAPALLVGSLRNRSAVARWCATALDRGTITRVTVVAAAEQWASTLDGVDGLRPSIEDWLGAGAIAHCAADMGVVLSAEAQAAAATFVATERYGLADWLRGSTTGRELIAKGFGADVDAAADLDADHAVPKLGTDGFFAAAGRPPG